MKSNMRQPQDGSDTEGVDKSRQPVQSSHPTAVLFVEMHPK